MELEQLKIIWDEQNQAPQFLLNETGLHAIIQRRIRESERQAACRYRAEIGISLICGIVMLAVAGLAAFGSVEWLAELRWPKIAATPWDIAALGLAGGIWFYFASRLNAARVRLQRSRERFDASLRGDINRALAQLDIQIEVARGVVGSGLATVGVSSVLWVIVLFRLSGGPAWSWMLGALVAIVALAIELSRQNDKIRTRYEPRQRELESLRSKLADPER